MTKQQGEKLKSGGDINRIGRPKGSRNKRTLIRQALQSQFPEGELGFWQAIATQAAGGDLQAASMLADRLFPKLKPKGETIHMDTPLTGSPLDMAQQIITATSEGEIDPSTARELLSALADVVRIKEVDELEQRLVRLEQQR